MNPFFLVITIFFWLSCGLIVYTHLGYPIVLWLLEAAGMGGKAGERKRRPVGRFPAGFGKEESDEHATLPTVSLIIAAYNEDTVIEAKVKNALALEYPRDLLQIIVALSTAALGILLAALLLLHLWTGFAPVPVSAQASQSGAVTAERLNLSGGLDRD